MIPSEERIQAVAEAMLEVNGNPYNEIEDFEGYAEAAIAAADATRPKLVVTDAVYEAYVQGYNDCPCPDKITMLGKCCDIAGLRAALKVMES